MKIYRWDELDAHAKVAVLARPALTNEPEVQRSVAEILDAIRRCGDQGLREQVKKIEGIDIDRIEAGPDDFAEARLRLSPAQREAIERAAANIDKFHRLQLAAPIDVETADGVRCERVMRPLRSVGLYVPAGGAPLPSTALMLGIPARIAGCATRVICSPQQPDGRLDAGVLFAAEVVGIDRVFRLGGAQAIAAMAYGTETVPKVDKVFGPGNTWVTTAKSLVSQDPDGAARDLPAGPSEVLVIADGNADPAFVAADLLSQAEHGTDSQVLLITTSAPLAERVVTAVDELKSRLSRREIIDAVLAHSCVLLVDDVEAAIELSNRYAPEHLILQIGEPRRWLPRVHAAGSVFLGAWTPESLGDYCSGTNHVLPTYGFARSYSSLGVSDFMRAMTIQEATPRGLEGIGPIAETLAAMEGLDAHGLAVSSRLDVIRREGLS